MSTLTERSDGELVDLLREAGPMGVAELARAMGVTATAVRQRLNRLLGEGLIQRRVQRSGRGRPGHQYSLTDKGVRRAGTNFDDLAVTLWRELRAIADPAIRHGLLRRIAERLAGTYRDRVRGETLVERMRSLAALFAQRGIPLRMDQSDRLPVLTALACPYPDLASQDRSVCAMERMLFADLLECEVRLIGCRLDGPRCCTFEVVPG